jgi:hypothetical protein
MGFRVAVAGWRWRDGFGLAGNGAAVRRRAWRVPAAPEMLRCLASGETRAICRPTACAGMAAVSKRLGVARCLMLMDGELRLA